MWVLVILIIALAIAIVYNYNRWDVFDELYNGNSPILDPYIDDENDDNEFEYYE
jgi:hypothetical protein